MPGSEQTTYIAARVCRVMSRAPSRPILYLLPYSDGAFFHLAVPSVSIRPSSSALPLSLSVCVSLPCSLFRSRTLMHLVANGTTVGQPAPLPTAIFPCAGEMAAASMVP
eukprot:scaffold5552_cov93-Isochrysis_galbana.AAC.1